MIEVMNNKSNSTTEMMDVYALPYHVWVVYETFSISLISLSLYIFVTQLRFACNTKKDSCWRKKSRHNSVSEMGSANISTLSSRRSRKERNRQSDKRKKNEIGQSAQSLKILCLLGAFLALVRISADQLELATYGSTRINCKTYQVMVVASYALSSTFIYSALWLRLRIFFFHPIMKHLTSTPIIILIWFALGCILISSLLNTAIFIATVQSVDSIFGCILGKTTSVTPTSRYVILTVSTVTSQGILLCLFLYPLVKHRSKVKALAAKNLFYPNHQKNSSVNPAIAYNLASSQRPNDKENSQLSRKMRREKRFIAVIWRVLFTAVVCVISDVIAAVITIVLGSQPRVVTNMVFNLNLIVNIISVLCSFGDWRKRLLPCCTWIEKPKTKLQSQISENFIDKNNQSKSKEMCSDDDLLKSPRRPSFLNKPGSAHPVYAHMLTNDDFSVNKADSSTFN